MIGPRWPGRLAAIAAAGVCFAAAARKIWSADFWWQLSAGRFIFEHGWPVGDVFSYTAAGAPWIEARWLYCLAQYLLWSAGGAPLVVTVKIVIIALAFGLAGRAAGSKHATVLGSAVTLVALIAASQRFFVRPEIVTYLFFGLFLLILDRHRSVGGRAIWLLPVLQLIWVNAHPLFVFGPLLIGALLFVEVVRVLLGDREVWRPALRPLRPLAVVLALTIAVAWINPWGLRGVVFPLELFGELRGTIFKEAIGELRSPFEFGLRWIALRAALLLSGVCVVAALANPRHLDPFFGVVLLAQVYLASLSIRNLPYFALAAIPFVVKALEDAPATRWLAQRLPAARSAIAIGLALFALSYGWASATDRAWVRQHDSNRFGFGVAEHRYCIGASEFLARHPPAGHIFGGLLENAYLMWSGHRVFIDSRLEVYGEEHFRRFLAVERVSEAWRAAAREFDIDVAVVDLQSPLVAILEEEPDFRLVFFDEVTAVYARVSASSDLPDLDERAQFDARLADVRRLLPRPIAGDRLGWLERARAPGPYLALTDFLLLRQRADAAAEFLADAQTAAPDLADLDSRRVALAELAGDWPRVIEQARTSLASTPGDSRMELALGTALFRAGRASEALPWLERAAERFPDRVGVQGLLGNLYAGLGRFDRAATQFARAAELAPDASGWRLALAEAWIRSGRLEDARSLLDDLDRRQPHNPRVERDLAVVQHARGDLESARRHLDEARRLDPDNRDLDALARQLGLP